MIVGGCPYCDGPTMTPIAPQCPAFSRETCGECGKEYWLKHSRIDPVSYPLEDVVVDEETRRVVSIEGVAV